VLQNYTGPFSPQRQFIRTFSPKIKISFDKGNFTVKTAENGAELEEVLKLRYDIFHREFLNKKFPFGLDIDPFDRLADHLIIIDRRQTKIVGTYRLISSRYSQSFYSQTEFHLDKLMTSPGTKLELSRACIQRDFRTGPVMNLLWRGLSQYLQALEAKYLFGCASIKTMDLGDVTRIYRYLVSQGQVSDEFGIAPTPDFVMPGFAQTLAALDAKNEPIDKEWGKKSIPPLFNSYLKMGAKVCSAPALDRDFRCVDYFTVLRVAELTRLYERKYTAC